MTIQCNSKSRFRGITLWTYKAKCSQTFTLKNFYYTVTSFHITMNARMLELPMQNLVR